MKIVNITEPNKFFSAVGECRGRVELVTGEGDRLNLKSTLCQYIALTQMFQDGQIEGVELPVQSVVTAAPRQCIQPDAQPDEQLAPPDLRVGRKAGRKAHTVAEGGIQRRQFARCKQVCPEASGDSGLGATPAPVQPAVRMPFQAVRDCPGSLR